MMTPQVSVIIPTANRPHLIGRAIRSVLAQTFQDFEIIIIDDGVKERAEEAVHVFADPRIRYFKNQTPRGGGGSRNRGIDEAQGEYISFLDDDDEWKPEKLAKHVSAFASGGADVGAVFSGVQFTGNKERTELLPNQEGPLNVLSRTLYRCYIWTSALSARRSLLLRERFDSTFTKNQEWDLEIRLAQQTKFFAINEPLVVIHVLGEDAHMGGRSNLANIIYGFECLLEKHHALYVTYPKAFARQQFRLAALYFESEQYTQMKQALFSAWRLLPTNSVYALHAFIALLGVRAYRFFRQHWKTSYRPV